MKKISLTKLEGYEKQSFFREHLRKTSLELYEWHLMLFYFWLAKGRQRRLRQVSGTPGAFGCTCPECGEKLIASGEYVFETVIYDPKINSFPPEFDNLTRLSVKSACDADFKIESLELVEDIQNEHGEDSLDFPDNAEKEYAAEYFFGNKLEPRFDVDPSNRNNFHWLSIEARCLSIIYENFSEYRNKFNFEDSDFLNTIDSITKAVIADSNKMIGYWGLADEKKKFQACCGRIGGSARKGYEEIFHTVRALIQEKGNMTASSLWTHFRLNADKYGFEYAEDQTGCGQHTLSVAGDDRPGIQFESFRRYVTKARQTMK